jgi:hypothetical protein
MMIQSNGKPPNRTRKIATASIKKTHSQCQIEVETSLACRSQPAGNFCLHLWRNDVLATALRCRSGVFRDVVRWTTSYTEKLVEPIGIEPMTPCLQSRCSPS